MLIAERTTFEVALVTGAGSGIGRATAHRLVARGARVVVFDRSADAAHGVVQELPKGLAAAVTGDVTSPEDVDRAVGAALAWSDRIDTVVANAGIEGAGTVDDLDLESWNRIVSVNLTGAFLTAKASLPFLRKSDRGSLVFVSSDAGLRGSGGWPAYGATKHAVVGLMRAMAMDHGPEGIRVNAVCPGWVATPLTDRVMSSSEQMATIGGIPLGRFATPEDVAEIIAHLSSAEAKHTTGLAYLVDGGENLGPFVAR